MPCRRCHPEKVSPANFCLECGPPVSDGPAGRSCFSSPDACPSKPLTEKILTYRSAMEGEGKRVTVRPSNASVAMTGKRTFHAWP